VTPDGRRAIVASADRCLRLWDLESGQLLWMLKGHTDAINSVAMTPDGRREPLPGSSKHKSDLSPPTFLKPRRDFLIPVA
jgi:WD40 repeat protein